jgi:membrane-bound lytic murein transglycosylase D
MMTASRQYTIPLVALAAVAAACASSPAGSGTASVPAPASGPAATAAAQPPAPPASATSQAPATPAPVLPAVAAQEVEQEAEQLFGADVLDPDTAVSFDIDVTSWATHRRVREYLLFFQTEARDRFSIWLSRLGRYEGMIREHLRHQGLPEDLVYLTLIESGLSNTAVSRARAVGMWQFMAGTGKLYGLEVTPWVDERRDPFRATDAAARHLADLVRGFGSVYLAAAAYNAGMGRVRRSIVKLPGDVPEALSDQTFFDLAERNYLRRETRDYVPKLIAAALIAKQPGRYGFTGIEPLQPLVFDEIVVPDATGLDVVARLSDTTLAAIVELNPHFLRRVTPPGREVVVRVPRGRGEAVAVQYAALPASERVTFVEHLVKRGETLSEIARGYRVSVALITGSNPGLKPRGLRVGQRVIIPLSGRATPAVALASAPAPEVRRTAAALPARATHRVRAGETLSAISRRYGVPLSRLLDVNDLGTDSVIKPGDRIRIPSRETAGSAQ